MFTISIDSFNLQSIWDDYPKKKGLIDMILGGGGSKSAFRWVLYRFIRDDLAESVRLLVANPHLVVE